MQEHVVECVKQGVALPKSYALATKTERNDENRPIIEQEVINKQRNGLYCRQTSSTMGFLGLTHNYDRNGLWTRIAPIDGAVQKSIPISLKARLLYQFPYPTLVGHPGEKICVHHDGKGILVAEYGK